MILQFIKKAYMYINTRLSHINFCLDHNCKGLLIYPNRFLTHSVTLIFVTTEFGKFCIYLYSRNIFGTKLWGN